MNIREKSIADRLRSAGYTSAFAFDDGIAIDADDAEQILSAIRTQAKPTGELMDELSKAKPVSGAKGKVNDASDFNF